MRFDFPKKSFQRGELIYAKGDENGELFYISEGVVSLELEDEDGQRQVIRQLGKGDLLGGMSFLVGDPKTSDAFAYTEVKCVIVDGKKREKLLSLVPKWFQLLIKDLVFNVKATFRNLKKVKANYQKMEEENRYLKSQISKIKKKIEQKQQELQSLGRQKSNF